MSEERIKTIEKLLKEKLQPSFLEVIDDSAAHAGHAGAQTGKGHFTIVIASAQFEGKNLIAKHRLVYDALDGLMETDIHAISIRLK